MGKRSLQDELRQFKTAASKDVPITRLILFGSRAAGKTGRDTDVDLIVVSSAFVGLDVFARGAKLYTYWTLDYPVDFLCYTPEEYERLVGQVTIVREAARTGIPI